MALYNMLVTEVTGNVLAATDYNNEHINHINNNIPTSIGGQSANVAGMQATTNPGGVGSESLATTLDGEIFRLRSSIASISGEAQWYVVPTTSLKTFVSILAKYRRPVLQFNSTTVVNVETGLDGTSGDCTILFPDGTLRTDTNTNRIRMTISQNAVFNSSTRTSNLGGLRSGSATANTWYAVYAVKVTAGTGAATDFVIVADTVIPTQANYATLNSNFGTNGWVYLGLIRYGDHGGATTSILNFQQAGNMTIFANTVSSGLVAGYGARGIVLASSSSVSSLTYTYTSGTGTTDFPANISMILYVGAIGSSATGQVLLRPSSNAYTNLSSYLVNSSKTKIGCWASATDGLLLVGSGATDSLDITGEAFIDGTLGVGANPLL